MVKRDELSSCQEDALAMIRCEGGVMLSHAQGARRFFTTNHGTPLYRGTIEALIRRGRLVPNQDGLWNGETQTYSPA